MRKFTILMAAAAALTANAAFAQGYTLNPAPGVVKDLQGITVTFEEPTLFYENNKFAAAVLENTTTGVVYNCETPDVNMRATTGMNTEYTLTFIDESEEEAEEVISTPGAYVLTIRAMYTEDAEGEPVDVDPIVANYTIEYPVAYTLNPTPGVVTDLQGIVITFEEKVEFFENNRMPLATLVNKTTGAEYVCDDPILNGRAMTEGSEYYLVFNELEANAEEDAIANIKEPGEYELTVKGMYIADDEDKDALPVIVAEYTINYPAVYSLNPAAGVATDLEFITLTFADDLVLFYENNRMPVATLENVTLDKTYVCTEPTRNTFTTAGSEWVFQFVDPETSDDEVAEGETTNTSITEPGEYLLTIRAAYLPGEEDEEEGTDLPVITAKYTIEYPYAYTLTPMSGSTVADLQGITLTFDDEVVSFYENNRMAVATLENLTTGVSFYCYEPDRNTMAEAASAYTFMFQDEDGDVLESITAMGDYVLTIKGMYIGDLYDEDGEAQDVTDLPVIVANYTVTYPYDYILDPASGEVASIEVVNLLFPNNTSIVPVDNMEYYAVLENGQLGDDNVSFYATSVDRDVRSEYGMDYYFHFYNTDDQMVVVNEPGMWYLTIRGFAVEEVADEDAAPEYVDYLEPIYAVYYISGEDDTTTKVVDLTSEDGLYNVYSIDGVQVVKNGDVNALKNLAKGIYVVNGHKVVIK